MPSMPLAAISQPVDHREHRDHGEAGAEEIDPARVRVSVLRQQPGADGKQQQHHRHREEKDGAPPEELEQQADRVAGPTAAPTEKLVAQTPIANVRCSGSRNMFRSDSVDGARVAAATPRRARDKISISTLVEKAASIEATPKAAAPMRSSRRRRSGRRAFPW